MIRQPHARLRSRRLFGDRHFASDTTRGAAWIAIALTATTLGACRGKDDLNNNALAAPSSTPSSSATNAGGITAMFQRKGPELLTTSVAGDGEAVRDLKANNGRFTIEQVNGVDTLLVNGKPARYQEGGAGLGATPMTVESNSSLDLVGVFELPEESVAWAMITGGSACPASHILVPVRNGVALPGQSIPGCDDRGTMRKVGNRIVFDAGGSEGYMEGGLLTIEAPAAADFEGGSTFK